MKKNTLIIALGAALIILIAFAFDDSFARSGGGSGGRGSGGRGSYGGKSAVTPRAPTDSNPFAPTDGFNPNATRGFNPYHQPFHSEVAPADNGYINKSPYFNPYAIPFNPMDGNDKVIRQPLYRYEDNFKSQY